MSGKKLLELAEQLVRQRLVVRHHQRGPLHALDDLGHGEGLAAARDTEQDLRRIAALDASDKLLDGARLIASGREIGHQFERGRHDSIDESTAASDCAKTWHGHGAADSRLLRNSRREGIFLDVAAARRHASELLAAEPCCLQLRAKQLGLAALFELDTP